MGAALAGLGIAAAQQPGKIHRIGYLRIGSAELDPYREDFSAGLRAFGYIEGRNSLIEYRYARDNVDVQAQQAVELARLPVAVIVTAGTTSIRAATRATRTIPIVMAAVDDPVAGGFVASLARPGGNVTGIAIFSAELAAKRLEILRESVPGTARVAILWNPDNESHARGLAEAERAAQVLRLAVGAYALRPGEGLDGVFRAMTADGASAVLILDDGGFVGHRRAIVDAALARNLPMIAGLVPFTDPEIMLTYATDTRANCRRASYFIDRILKGESPGNIPVEQVSKVLLRVNLKTAKALGITIPQTILFRADEVIE